MINTCKAKDVVCFSLVTRLSNPWTAKTYSQLSRSNHKGKFSMKLWACWIGLDKAKDQDIQLDPNRFTFRT